MIIKPKVRGFICTNAHPVGCAANVREQIEVVQNSGSIQPGSKNALIIGSSTGYGLASRIAAAFGSNAATLGVFFEKPPSETKTASAGYYNSAAFHKEAKNAGLYAESINGDAFSDEIKQQVIEKIKADMGKIDLVVYSLASPRRADPKTGITFNSTLKPIGKPVTNKSLDTSKNLVTEVSLDPASDEEIANTIKVMGGEDWEWWIDALSQADVLTEDCKTVAYTYIGKKITWPIYGQATIGKAKEDLDRVGEVLNRKLSKSGGEARVCVLKGLVTQASSAIPVMPLYISLLYKVMKEAGTHEGCIEQINRLFRDAIYAGSPELDEKGRWRVDDLELDEEIQQKVEALWEIVNSDNLLELSDYQGYQQEFLKLFGFGIDGVDYEADLSPLLDP
jgi:enoyl-[acyl-carrier protein] reductase/trans-2-enoyl-CoA reductase (NAD+)|tara:strand:+ start:66849 stop:68027 length:1179 start_codon:yes stop_codon:yes gene_type:complete